MTITPNQVSGYIVVGSAGDALVVKRPWPFLSFGADPTKAIREDARRWTVSIKAGVLFVVELELEAEEAEPVT